MPRHPAKPKKTPIDSLHALRVELADIEPSIYRALLVRSSVTLGKLHEILQHSFCWSDEHLHQFTVVEHPIANRRLEPGHGQADEESIRLRDALPNARSRLRYEYDFGDGWLVVVRAVAIRAAVAGGPRLPAVMLVDGARAAPPEDCGGVGGYLDLCDAMADPSHPRRDDLLEWLGGEPFDPEAFPRRVIEANLDRIR